MTDINAVAGAKAQRQWLILGVIGLAQLMVVLDATVMNIALPSAQRALHFTTVDRRGGGNRRRRSLRHLRLRTQ